MFNGAKLFGTDILVGVKDTKVKGASRERWPVPFPGTCLATEPTLSSGLEIETQIGPTVSDRCLKLVLPTLWLEN